MAERAYDVALLGATGFTGALTATEIARRAPADLRWALAGRSRAKLEAARDAVAAAVPGAPVPELVIADVEDRASLDALAAATRVLTTTVGPYALHGEPVVAACAEHGTGYLDLTGEPEFADRMYCAHHARAVETGARIIHACGFDSIPHDLGAQFAVEQLPEGVPLTVRGYVRGGGRISGGTFASALTGFSRPRENLAAARARKAAEPPRDPARRVRPDGGRPHRARGHWAIPLPTIDPQVIARSARAQERYGPDFRYGHYAAVKRLPIAVGGAAGVMGLVAAAQIGPLRRTLLSRLPQGDGPTDAQMDAGWFTVTMVGEAATGERVVCEVRGGDPGYRETSRMLADATLCLALDDLPDTAGQVTTAQALGPKLRERLIASGIRFDVLERG